MNAERWIRTACWVGAITDAGAALQMLSPRVFAFAYRPNAFRPGPDYRYAMGMGASLMIGWTVLLLWAAARPIERRGVLLMTVVPVIAGLVVNEIASVGDAFIPAGPLAPVWTLQFVLSALFVTAYVLGGRARHSNERARARSH